MKVPRLVQDYLRDILDAGKDRVLVRYSGTQPQCRVMVESTE